MATGKQPRCPTLLAPVGALSHDQTPMRSCTFTSPVSKETGTRKERGGRDPGASRPPSPKLPGVS